MKEAMTTSEKKRISQGLDSSLVAITSGTGGCGDRRRQGSNDQIRRGKIMEEMRRESGVIGGIHTSEPSSSEALAITEGVSTSQAAVLEGNSPELPTIVELASPSASEKSSSEAPTKKRRKLTLAPSPKQKSVSHSEDLPPVDVISSSPDLPLSALYPTLVPSSSATIPIPSVLSISIPEIKLMVPFTDQVFFIGRKLHALTHSRLKKMGNPNGNGKPNASLEPYWPDASCFSTLINLYIHQIHGLKLENCITYILAVSHFYDKSYTSPIAGSREPPSHKAVPATRSVPRPPHSRSPLRQYYALSLLCGLFPALVPYCRANKLDSGTLPILFREGVQPEGVFSGFPRFPAAINPCWQQQTFSGSVIPAVNLDRREPRAAVAQSSAGHQICSETPSLSITPAPILCPITALRPLPCPSSLLPSQQGKEFSQKGCSVGFLGFQQQSTLAGSNKPSVAQSTAAAPSRKILMADNASETSGISTNPMSSSGQVQLIFTMAGTRGSGLQIVSEKLSETNYASWAVAVELYVEGHDKLDILHGTKVKPDEKDPSFRTWRRDNIQLMTWMLNSVNSGIKQVILHNKTTYDMWKTLEQMYGRRHDMLCTYQISSQIFKLEQGSMSVTNYFATLKGLWDEFDYYRMKNWSSTDDHQRYLKLLEKDRIIKFLDGLTSEFESLKGQILGLDPTPSLEQVYYKILSKEGRKRTMNNKGISTGGPLIGETSVFISSANKFRPGGTKRQGDRFCRHYKRTNHDSDFCWEKYPEKKPEKFKHNAKKAPNSSNIAIQKLESEETICSSVSSITGLSSTDIVNLQHLLSRFQASSSASTPADSTPFQAHTEFESLKRQILGKGSIKLTDHFFLSSALHDLETKQTIGTGREVGGLYYYQLETTSALKSAAKHKQEPPIDRLVESDALAPDPVKQLSSSIEPTTPLNMNELDLPVAVRKGVRSCTQHPISNHVSYSRLSPSYHAFVSQLSNHDIPSSYYEAEIGKLGSRPAATPIEVNHDLTSSSGEDLTSLEKGTYQRLVGKLLYLSITRPDITYTVSVVSQYMHAPKTIHMKAVDRILRYLKSCPGKGLLFKGGGDLKVECYSDADWVGSRDDRRSTSGYCTFLGGNLVTWRSKKQNVCAQSSAEAEYRAMAHGLAEMLWLSFLLTDIGLKVELPLRLYCDNKAAINIANNPIQHDRTKHIKIDRHFIRERLDSGELCLPYVKSEDQLADIFTKAIPQLTSQSIVPEISQESDPKYENFIQEIKLRITEMLPTSARFQFQTLDFKKSGLDLQECYSGKQLGFKVNEIPDPYKTSDLSNGIELNNFPNFTSIIVACSNHDQMLKRLKHQMGTEIKSCFSSPVVNFLFSQSLRLQIIEGMKIPNRECF
ncbi:hypothetical protein ZIOFF_024198 [Zingiber officinale]|uniref:Retrotransposon Copia-like N-terminal domain-containing protein n=1 Tax=Zingiber officinale TaxID=94328 RepID=A0A8J5H040_ZINOF|nr:hypothetical protein ZIOFF_024198 [Zingiber officinale]